MATVDDFCIVIDTREVRPYRFQDVPVLFQTLATGDYSIKGWTDKIAIERKTHGDVLSSLCGHRRDQFMAEMERLSKFKTKCLMIEATMDALFRGTHPFQKKMRPEAVIGSLVKILVDYNIPVVMAHGYRYASELTLKILRRFYELQRGTKVADVVKQIHVPVVNQDQNEMVRI